MPYRSAIKAAPLALAWLLTAAGAGPPARTVDDLRRQLSTQLAASKVTSARWGIVVQALRDGQTLFERDPDQLFIPASNTKLFTCALALDRLGASGRLLTTLRAAAPSDARGVVPGDLVVEGGGDPGDEAFNGGDPWMASVERVAAEVSRLGIKTVRGALVCDAGAFLGPPYGDGWDWSDLEEEYAPAVTALVVHDNGARIRIDPTALGQPARLSIDGLPPSVTGAAGFEFDNHTVTGPTNARPAVAVERLPGDHRAVASGVVPLGGASQFRTLSLPDPAWTYGQLLRQALTRRGVAIDGATRVRASIPGGPPAPSAGVVLASIPSAPVAEIVRRTLKASNNLYAQLLLLAVGKSAGADGRAETSGLTGMTTEAAGLRALGIFLSQFKIDPTQASLVEGSGLARRNLASPLAIARLLRGMARHRSADAWNQAFPIGGVDGTLRDRFHRGRARANVRAKTGSLSGVYALSGYVTTASGDTLVFSILTNNCVGERAAEDARQQIDNLVETLADYEGRIGPASEKHAAPPAP